MTEPIFTQGDLQQIRQAQAAEREATALVPTIIPTQPGDLILVAGVALPDAAVLVGDHLVVRPTHAAEDGKIVIGYRAASSDYTVTRAPVGEGVEVKGLVVGLVRSLK